MDIVCIVLCGLDLRFRSETKTSVNALQVQFRVLANA